MAVLAAESEAPDNPTLGEGESGEKQLREEIEALKGEHHVSKTNWKRREYTFMTCGN